MTGLLPPNARALEDAIDLSGARLDTVPVPLRDLWNPQTCPASLLPWLAWGLSIDFWDTDWSEERKRAEIAQAIAEQKRKGTRASLQAVIDRFDPLIDVTEWFEDRNNLDPHTFRLNLPLAAETAVEYDEAALDALFRDIDAVKPLRSTMYATHRVTAEAALGLIAAATLAGTARSDHLADIETAQEPEWATYLQTEDGEPLQAEDGTFLEAA